MQVKNLLIISLVTSVSLITGVKTVAQNSYKLSSKSQVKVEISTPELSNSYWNKALLDYSKTTGSRRNLSYFLKLSTTKLHDLVYEDMESQKLEHSLEKLISDIRNVEPAALEVLDLITYYLAARKNQWDKVITSGYRISNSRLIKSMSLPNLEYFLYQFNNASEMLQRDLDPEFRFSTEMWLLPTKAELKQANLLFLIIQTNPSLLQSSEKIALDSPFYQAYFNAIAHLSELGLTISGNDQWMKLRARRNPRRRHLESITRGLPPQLTLAIMKIKRALRAATSNFQSYNALLQLAYLSEMAGRKSQYLKSLLDAIQLHPTASVYIKVAEFYRDQRKYSKMHEFNQLALKLDPQSKIVDGPTPQVKLKESRDDSSPVEKNPTQLLTFYLDNSKASMKELINTLSTNSDVSLSNQAEAEVNALLETIIPRESLSRWIEVWSEFYPTLAQATKNKLQARILLWLQIMIYSGEAPQSALTARTKLNLSQIANESILGNSIRKCLESLTPSDLHQSDQ